MSFDALVEEIYFLDYENKIELKTLLEKYIIEERRSNILKQHKEAIKMADNGDLHFSDNTEELLSILEQ